MLGLILIGLLVLALVGGSMGHRKAGLAGWSPAGIIVVILVIMLVSGRI
jgi:hypothetical protein